jgi:hypothetical protein
MRSLKIPGLQVQKYSHATSYHACKYSRTSIIRLQLTVPLTSMQFLSTLSAGADLWADSRSYIDTRKENGKWASE